MAKEEVQGSDHLRCSGDDCPLNPPTMCSGVPWRIIVMVKVGEVGFWWLVVADGRWLMAADRKKIGRGESEIKKLDFLSK